MYGKHTYVRLWLLLGLFFRYVFLFCSRHFSFYISSILGILQMMIRAYGATVAAACMLFQTGKIVWYYCIERNDLNPSISHSFLPNNKICCWKFQTENEKFKRCRFNWYKHHLNDQIWKTELRLWPKVIKPNFVVWHCIRQPAASVISVSSFI